MSEKLLYKQDGHIVTLTLNQPELRNPITDVDFVELFVAAITGTSSAHSAFGIR